MVNLKIRMLMEKLIRIENENDRCEIHTVRRAQKEELNRDRRNLSLREDQQGKRS